MGQMGLYARFRNLFQTKPTGNIITEGDTRWWGGNSFVSDTHAGEIVNQDSLLTSATCFACTKALAETLAGLPGTIYRTSDKRQEEDRKQPAFELLAEQPNPEMDAYTFYEMVVARVVNRGNFFAEIQRDAQDRPIALWPIHNSRVEPMRDPEDGSLYWQVASDFAGSPRYEDPSWRRKHLMYLSPHNMLNIVGPFSPNGIMSPGMLPAAQEIGLDFATRKFGSSFFAKGATPSGIVEHPGFIDHEGKRNQFRADMNQIHANAANAHRIGVLWQGAKYHQISIAPEQAQFLETRKYTSDQLCKFYGVPPAIIGDYTDSKFATADAMVRAFVMLTLRNLVVRVEKAINRQVLNVRGENGRMARAFSKPLIYNMAIDGLLRGDPKTQADTHRVYRESGILATNEIREEIGYNPIDGPEGDYIIVNGGVARLDKIDEQGTRSKNSDEASLPNFDRNALAEMIASSGLCESPAQARGATLEDNPLIEAVVDLAIDATTRIHKIALSQIQRWREQDPAEVATKLPEFWKKQETRLREALQPCEKIALRVSVESNVTELLVAEYLKFADLDNYQIFDAAKTELFDVEYIVRGEL